MKNLLLPKILARKRGGGGYVKTPMLSFSADAQAELRSVDSGSRLSIKF